MAQIEKQAARRGVRTLRVLGRATLDWLYPPSCVACGEEAGVEGALCAACWRDAAWIVGERCALCAAPFGVDSPRDVDLPFDVPSDENHAPALHDQCGACARHPRAWRRGAAACLYEGAARALVLALKHGDRLEAAQPMARWMARAGRPLWSGTAAEGGAPPLLTPAPLHWARRLGRGYNQALELARHVSALAEVELAPDVLRRVRRTQPQAQLGASARRGNVARAFRVRSQARALIQDRRIIIVDDVLTTGATLSECAQALRDAGAHTVDILVFARAVRDPSAPPRSAL